MEDKYIGQQYGCYKIIEKSTEKTTDNHCKYVGRCVGCGYIQLGRIQYFQRVKRRTCIHIPLTTVKSSKQWQITQLRACFNKMYMRCYDINERSYRFYGAKGIEICKEWLEDANNFQEWALHNGYEKDLTIDRIDSQGNYCPENCRWISREENARFKSSTNYITINGVLHSGREWSVILHKGINFINTMKRKHGMEYTKEYIQSNL